MTERKRVVVGVAGGIAAYKACTVVRQLAEAGHSVRVVPTESALRFVGAATFEALSGQPVRTGVFEDVDQVPHVRIGQEADLVVVAPATADLLARAVAGPRRRPPHRNAADRAMSGGVRTGDAHRDVVPPRDRRRTSRPCAAAGTSSSNRRPADSPAPTAAQAASPSRRRSRRSPSCCSTAPTPCRTTCAGSRCSSPPAAPANPSTRCASSATAVRASRVTRWPGSPLSAAPTSR